MAVDPVSFVRGMTRRVARAVSAVLLPVGLVLCYVIGVTLSWLLMAVLAPRRLFARSRGAAPRWSHARGYDESFEDCRRPS